MIFLTIGLQYLHEDLHQVPTVLEFSVCLFLNDAEGITKHILNYMWDIRSQNNNIQVIQMTH